MTSLRLTLFAACLLLAGFSTHSFAQCGVPTGLNVTNVAFPSATLGWTAVSGATSYVVNVQNASGNNTPFNLTLNPATNTVTVNSFPVQGNYKFKVRSRCGGNNSNWSQVFFFTVGAGGGGGGSCNSLGTPTGLNVTNIAFPNATLGWNSVAGATSYSVNVQNASGNATPLDTTFTSVTTSVVFGSFPVTGNYKFKVRALCGANTGSWSADFFFTVGTGGGGGGGNCGNLGTPTGLNVTNVAFPSATLGWTAVSGATSYVVNVQNASGNNTPFNLTLNVATLSVVVNSFPVEGNYKFKVRAACGGNTGSWSPVFNFTVGAGGGGGGGNCNNLGTPTGLNVTNIAFPSATLGWNAVSGATSYSVNVQNASGNATPLDTTFTSATTSVVFGSFPVEGNYKFKVRALCGANDGNWSAVFNFTVGAGGGGGGGNCNNLPAPTGLNVTNVAFPSATLGWNAVPGATGYVVNVQNASGNNTPFNMTLTTTNTSVVVNTFPVEGNYKFKVRATCGGSTGSWSPVFNFTVGNGGGGGGGGNCNNLPAPTGLNVTGIAFPSATLGWTAVSGATSYSVNVQNATPNNTEIDTTFTSAGTSIVFGSFPVAGNYKFKVRALCGAETGDWADDFVFNVSFAPPSNPNSLLKPNAGAGFSMFPNPAQGLVSLNLDDFAGQTVSVRVLDLAGKVRHSEQLGEWAGGNFELNLRQAQAGLYLVEVQADGQRLIQKLLLQ